jgi:hypothetical protein
MPKEIDIMIIIRDEETRALELMLIIWQPHLLGKV